LLEEKIKNPTNTGVALLFKKLSYLFFWPALNFQTRLSGGEALVQNSQFTVYLANCLEVLAVTRGSSSSSLGVIRAG